jgi:4-amino-4-deoxy-L-arabinose transferase-like glycosyltransferase
MNNPIQIQRTPKVGTLDQRPVPYVSQNAREIKGIPPHGQLWWLPYSKLIPWVLALVCALFSLRTVNSTGVIDTDAARHAMNGAFIRDAIATGNIFHPIQYGRWYYAHLPGLSMPYHPPLVPFLESVFFFLFGVNLFSARLLVALCAGLSIVLLYKLVLKEIGSHLVAAATVVTFFLWPVSQNVAGDVMLEYPSMVFCLAALHCLSWTRENSGWRKGLGFALLGAAAFWSKQHSVFLAFVPFVYLALRHEWRGLSRFRLWWPVGLLGVAIVALARLSARFRGTGVKQVVDGFDSTWFQEVFLHNTVFYVTAFAGSIGIVSFLLLGVALIAWLAALWKSNPQFELFGAWALSAFAMLLALGLYDVRYTFYVYPPLLAMAYATVKRASAKILTKQTAWVPVGLFMGASAVAGLQVPAPRLTGISEAASAIVTERPQRILYCGSADGNFVFAVRSLQPSLDTVIFSGEKLLEPSSFSVDALDTLVRDRKIEYVVVEHTPRPQMCNALNAGKLGSLQLEKKIPMTSSLRRFDGGTISIYRFAGTFAPSDTPPLNMEVPRVGLSVEVP